MAQKGAFDDCLARFHSGDVVNEALSSSEFILHF
jgi:hypothetical protein